MKEYIKPSITIFKIDTESIMAASMGVDSQNQNEKDRAKDYDFEMWDDEVEE